MYKILIANSLAKTLLQVILWQCNIIIMNEVKNGAVTVKLQILHTKQSNFVAQIACTYSEWIKVERAINSDLLLVDKWYYLNNLERNKANYETIVMGKRWNKQTFRCENTIIHINSSLKILGVNINDLLKFDNHLFKISRKVSQQIVVARRLKKMLPFETGRDLYLSFIAPHVKYCSEPWHFCIKRATDKLEKINERAIRFVFKDKNTKYEKLLRHLGLLTLQNHRLIKIITSVFKVLHSNMHHYVLEN